MTCRSALRLLLAACFVAGLLSIAGCSSSSSALPAHLLPPTSIAAPGASVPFHESNNARADVSTGTCTQTQQGWALHGSVDNPGTKYRSFQIVVDFVSEPGSTVLATTVLNVHRVPPGRSAGWTAVGAKGESGISCVVRLAQSV